MSTRSAIEWTEMPGAVRADNGPAMGDGDIRRALMRRLERSHDKDPYTLIRHELGVRQGRRRVDVAVINGELAGYEIKSDRDTLVRLADQAQAYGEVLDRLWLVTTSRYVQPATAILPAWWGVILATPRGEDGRSAQDTVSLRTARRARLNVTQDPFAVAQLLWRAEALDVLRERDLHRGMSKRARWYVWERLASSVELGELRGIVRDRLKARREWPTVR
jgi:hypothetical protein